ncbi:S-adenosyl-L-methionine-dependent methyltransferase [Echria macrotheca]|uniref:Arsenite methyltransferase n=1 Tax=Echria macrotheca TaxID=438768 RepID=A0AAJ0FBX8_9PEZI|nr:S-adenosyl-L-methionine-dependent methyltransferase [Echria macrotheca]
MDSAQIYNQVHEHYSAASKGTTAQYSEAIAKSFGYSPEELANIPEGANLGLSCGNPLAITSLRPGETVIDLGSGAGFDVFLASSRIGPTGRAIGVDMNDDMLARANKIKESKGADADNVTFVKGVITDIPLDDGIADCIISNCVINLVPAADKHLVFNEMHRLLKSGGRVAVSDILAKKELPPKLKNDLALYVGCIAGAAQVFEYEQWLKEAGFDEVLIADTKADLNVYLEISEDGTKKKSQCCDDTPKCCVPSAAADEKKCGCVGSTTPGPCCSSTTTTTDISVEDLNEWVGSYKIYAVKK